MTTKKQPTSPPHKKNKEMKKAIVFLLAVLLGFAPGIAQDNRQRQQKQNRTAAHHPRRQNDSRQFNPEEYQRQLEAHITKFAGLTQQEAKEFFPLFREMQKQQRAIFMKQKKMDKSLFTDNKAALEAITQHDNAEIQIKKLQQNYHKRFLKILPATKVLKCITAEDVFNRQMMRGFAGRQRSQ